MNILRDLRKPKKQKGFITGTVTCYEYHSMVRLARYYEEQMATPPSVRPVEEEKNGTVPRLLSFFVSNLQFATVRAELKPKSTNYPLNHQLSTIYFDAFTGYIRSVIRNQKRDELSHVLWLPESFEWKMLPNIF